MGLRNYPCSVESCDTLALARGLCKVHYDRVSRLGTTDLPKRPTLAERFWSKVDKTSPEKCWLWQAGTNNERGYFWHHGQMVPAPRIAWELTNGRLPAGMHALHKCDNPPCCNPNHLFLGTHADNMADAATKDVCKRAAARRLAKMFPCPDKGHKTFRLPCHHCQRITAH